jgi:HD-GYP domain-containing protein (c-di-GMP phosphodiesterase class II)/DNA-binding CsgD family transcriptional regulator
MERSAERVELAGLVAAISLAADLASGVTLEHGLRTCLLATRLAGRAGLDEAGRRDVYYTALLRSIGCTSDAHEQSVLFGNEIAARTELNLAAHLPPRQLLGVLARHAGSGEPPLRRARALARALAAAPDLPRAVATAHCQAAERLGRRLGFSGAVPGALNSLFERWDGKGHPRGLRGEDIPPAARFTQVAYDALLLHEHLGGTGQVAAAAGTLYDPWLAGLLDPGDVAEAAGLPSPWDETLAAEPGGPTPIDGERLDEACRAAADFADLTSPWLLGHSRAVAELAEAAAWRLGLAGAEVDTVRRAALLHDLGRVTVPAGIWDRPGPLRGGDWELVRLHAYQTERALARSAGLAALGAVAGAHHERLDGSGYHRGAQAGQLAVPARLLAAADAYQAMTEDRPHRPALPPAQAAAEVQDLVRAGRLDGDCAAAVLAAAGLAATEPSAGGQAGPAASRRRAPGELSPREVEVLGLLARGQSNRQIAARLGITPKTAGHHVQHIYTKIGVSSRATAALFALENGLLSGNAG